MLKHIDVTLESWQDILPATDKLLDYVSNTFGYSEGCVPYSDDGLSQVPVTNKQWASWVGYEHDEQTLWFKVSVKKSFRGFFSKQYYGARAVYYLARSVVWNAALYIHYLEKPLQPQAMFKAIKQSIIQDSTCPQELTEPLALQLSRLCYRVLSVICTTEGTINRCGVQLLKDNLDAQLKGRTCTNRALRRNVCLQLVAQGIGGLKTRLQQRNRIIETLKGYDNLKGSAVRSIERMLTLDKELLKMNGGVSILLPYTPMDKKIICTNEKSLELKNATRERAMLIYEKSRNGVILTAAERKFKSRHKDMFEQ